MSRTAGRGGTGGTPRGVGGLVAGITLRAIRESLGLTQEQLAGELGVDPNTVKGWETGRRPLIATSGRTFVALRRQLLSLGARGHTVEHLNTALDADLFVAQVLEGEDVSPLGSWVATRSWSDLLAWVLADKPPALLRSSLRQVPGSALPAGQRARFFEVIRTAAERTHAETPQAMLLRRQVYYMAAWDPSRDGRDWLAAMERRELARIRRAGGWSPAWPLLRSTAVARACQGDPTLLHDFIAHHLNDDVCEAANLNYWSYWVEESTGTATTDEFMAADLGPWRGATLLQHLTDGLSADVPYVSLSIHAAASLVRRRSELLMHDPDLARRLRARATVLLDSGVDIPTHVRRDLENIHYATAMVDGTMRRTDV